MPRARGKSGVCVCVCLQSKHKRRGRTRPHRLTLPLSTSLYTTRHSVRGGCRGVAEPLGFPTRFKAGSRKADPFFIPWIVEGIHIYVCVCDAYIYIYISNAWESAIGKLPIWTFLRAFFKTERFYFPTLGHSPVSENKLFVFGDRCLRTCLKNPWQIHFEEISTALP